MRRYSNNGGSYRTSAPGDSGSLLGRAVAFVVGIGAFVLSLVVGAVFLAVIVGFVLLVGTVIAVRIWWVGRKMARQQSSQSDLDAEYTVISTEERIRSDETRR